LLPLSVVPEFQVPTRRCTFYNNYFFVFPLYNVGNGDHFISALWLKRAGNGHWFFLTQTDFIVLPSFYLPQKTIFDFWRPLLLIVSPPLFALAWHFHISRCFFFFRLFFWFESVLLIIKSWFFPFAIALLNGRRRVSLYL